MDNQRVSGINQDEDTAQRNFLPHELTGPHFARKDGRLKWKICFYASNLYLVLHRVTEYQTLNF